MFPLERAGSARDGPETKRARLSDSENSDDDEEEGVEMEGVAVVSGDSTSGQTAEQKAAEARANKPLEERQKIFKDMLLERGVSWLGLIDITKVSFLWHNTGLCFLHLGEGAP